MTDYLNKILNEFQKIPEDKRAKVFGEVAVALFGSGRSTLNPVPFEQCGADLDGDILYYHGQPVVVDYRKVWFNGYKTAAQALPYDTAFANSVKCAREETQHGRKDC